MNNKGFGVTGIFIFAIFAILAIWVFYSFVSNVASEFMPKNHVKNYKNEYTSYANVKTTSNRITPKEAKVNEISNQTYDEMETLCIDSAEKYINRYYPNINRKDRIYINISKLNSYGYLPLLKDAKSGEYCTGYVVAEKSINIEYNAYIKCGDNYMSNGYLKSLDK